MGSAVSSLRCDDFLCYEPPKKNGYNKGYIPDTTYKGSDHSRNYSDTKSKIL